MKMNLKNLKLAVLIAASAAFMSGATAIGAEFSTPGFILTLQTPENDWQQVSDKETWATLSDGIDRITLLHYSNGEKLPEMTVAGNGYAQVCQNIISTENEVFIITGSVVDKENFEEVQEAVQSVVINKYDTKKAVRSDSGTVDTTKKTGTSDGTEINAAENNAAEILAAGNAVGTQKQVEQDDFTVWVTSQQLNVRSESSTKAAILGTVSYMDAVQVTGIEKSGGAATGWYQVDYNGSKGYISSQYVSETPSTAESQGYTLTSEQITLYTSDGMSANYVYKATNGNWYDGSGRQYQQAGKGRWTCLSSGATWVEAVPQDSEENAAYQVDAVDGVSEENAAYEAPEEENSSQALSVGTDGAF